MHAAATPYRERSHFDGQDVLESGLPKPGRADTGWLNRALGGARSRKRACAATARAFAVGPVTPLVVRGPAPVLSWTPPRMPPASDDTMTRLLDLYRHTDPTLARVLEERIGPRRDRARRRHGRMAPTEGRRCRRASPRRCAPISPRRPARRRSSSRAPDGPRIGALAFDGWDTHVNEGADQRPARDAARRARRRARGGRDEHGRGLARDRGRGGHRVRPHRAHQRHRRHRSRHRARSRCSPAARSRAAA